MQTCPNKELESYKSLEKEFGDIISTALFHMNKGKIPTIEQSRKLLDSKILNIIHHFTTIEDAQNKTSSNTDIPLDDEGKKNAEELAKTEKSKQIKTIYSSPLERATQSAEILAKYNDANIISIDGLKSWNIGKFDGEPDAKFPEEEYVDNPNKKLPDGESYNEFKQRFINTIQSLRNISEDAAILTHSRGIAILKSQELNYGDFNAQDYLKIVQEAESIKDIEDIRQFNEEPQFPTTTGINSGQSISQPLFTPTEGLNLSKVVLSSNIETPKTRAEIRQQIIDRLIKKGTTKIIKPSKLVHNLLIVSAIDKPKGQPYAIAKRNSDNLNKTYGYEIATPEEFGDSAGFYINPSREQIDKEFLDYSNKWYAKNSPTINAQGENNFTSAEPIRTPAETVYDKLIKSQKELNLDETNNPETGQRRHQYYVTRNGVRRDLGPSVTTRIEKKFNPKEEDKDFNLSIADRGTQIHKDLENEIKSWLTDDNELSLTKKDNAEKNTPDHIFSSLRTLAKEVIDFYKQKNITGLKIIPECKVVDEIADNNKGIPGTIDLLVLYPDNSYDKYDWKNIYNLSEKKRVDMSRRGYFKEQADGLADILKNAYGSHDRRIDIMLPLNLQGLRTRNSGGIGDTLTLENIEVAPFSFGKLDPTKMYLQPVVIHYAETDNEQIQKYYENIDKVIKQTLQAKQHGDDADIQIANTNANRLERALFDTIFRKDVSTMTNEILNELEMIHNIIKNEDKSVDLTKSLERLKTYDESSPFIQIRLQEGKEQIKAIETRLKDTDISDEDRTILEEGKRITQDRLYQFNIAAQEVKNSMQAIRDYAAKFAQKQADIAGFNEDANAPEKEVQFGDKNLTLASQVERTNLMTALQIIHEATAKSELAREELSEPIIKDITELKKTNKDLLELYKTKFLDKTANGYKWKHTIDHKFFEERDVNAILAAGTNLDSSVQWFKDNTTFNRARFNRDLKNLEEKFDKLISLNYNTVDEKAIAIEQFKQEFDVNDDFSNRGALLNGQKGNKYIQPLDKWFSEDYKIIQKDVKLLQFYDDCMKLNFKLAELGMITEGQAYTFFPVIEANFSQAWQQGNKEGLNKLIGRMADSITMSDAEKEAQGNLDPLSGKENLELSIAGLHGFDKSQRQSVDIGSNYQILAAAIAKYEELTKVIPDVNLLLLAEKNKKMFPFTKRGQTSKTPIENTTNYNFMQSVVDYVLYGKVTGHDTTIKVWNNFLTRALQLSDKNLSWDKTVSAILDYTVIRGLAFSLNSILSNIVGGGGNILFQNYNSKLLLKAEQEVLGRKSKYKQLSKYFLPHTEDSRQRELQKETAAKKLIPSFGRVFLSGMRWGDEGIQELCNILELMHSMLDENDKRVNIKQYLLRSEEGKAMDQHLIDKKVEELSKTRSLYATVKFDQDKNPYWEDASGKKIDMITPINGHQSNRTMQQRAAKDISNRVIGARTTDDPMGANFVKFVRAFFTYRNWIPGQLNARLKGMRFIPAQGTYIQGRWKLFGQLLTHTRVSANILFGMFGGDRFAPNVKYAAKESYEKAKHNYEKENPGKTFNMDETEYLHQYVNTIQSYGKELLLTIGFLVVAAALKPNKDASEDEKARRAYMAKYFKNFYQEFSFYVDPRSFVQMFNNSIPAITTLTDLMSFISDLEQEIQGQLTGNTEKINKNYPTKKGVKFIPGARQLIDVEAMMNADFRKDWNIKYNQVQYF